MRNQSCTFDYLLKKTKTKIPRVFSYLLLQLQHLSVLLALPISEFLRVLPHLPHQLCTLSLY